MYSEREIKRTVKSTTPRNRNLKNKQSVLFFNIYKNIYHTYCSRSLGLSRSQCFRCCCFKFDIYSSNQVGYYSSYSLFIFLLVSLSLSLASSCSLYCYELRTWWRHTRISGGIAKHAPVRSFAFRTSTTNGMLPKIIIVSFINVFFFILCFG